MAHKRAKTTQGETITAGGVSTPPPQAILSHIASSKGIESMETHNMLPKNVQYFDSNLFVNQATLGAKLETKIEQLLHQNESTGETTAPLLYTAREQGVKASTNIRTDRWEVAVEAAGKVARSYLARREERAKAGKDPDAEAKKGEGHKDAEGKPETNAAEGEKQ